MGNTYNTVNFSKKSKNGFYINSGRSKKSFTNRLSAKLRNRSLDICIFNVKHFTYKRETVRVNTAGRKCDDNISCLHLCIVNNLVLINYTNSKTCKVVFINGIETGHFRCFAADKCSTGLNAALSYTRYDCSNLFRKILAYSYIVKEEQRFCTATDNVIYAHSNAVDTNSIMLICKKCHLKLCTNTVSTAYQNRLCDTCHIKFEKTTETADT